MNQNRTLLNFALGSVIAIQSASAAIYTFADFTRPANGPNVVTNNDFVPNEGWSGTPPNNIAGEESLYLTYTVSWTSSANIGSFNVSFNRNDDGGAGRWGMGTQGPGFGFNTGNSNVDPDGPGPATTAPVVAPVDTTTTTSVTLVLLVDQIQANISPGGDFWFTDIAQQDGAAGFVWIDPDLSATEESQPTPIAAWRSSNNSYQGVRFTTNTADVDLNFSNIAIYTGDDSPFAAIPEPSSMLLLSLSIGGLFLRRR